jgi:phosphatidylglycerol:prolipoprotein diacylglycerol transferase
MFLLAIPINIDPNIAQIGPFMLSWHGLFSAIGVIAGVTVGVRVAAEAGASEEGTYNLALWSVDGGIVGARLFHVVDNWTYYSQNPLQIVLINEGGIAIYGAIVGGVLTGVAYARLTHLPIAKVADGGAVGLILGQAIGRIGDVINGEHHGKPLDAPYAVVYTHPNTLGELGLPVHLAVGYELIWDLLIFGLLWQLRGRFRPGVIFWTYFLLYGLGRFWISFYRYDAIQAFGLSQAQLVAVVAVVLGGAMLVKMLLIDRPRTPAPLPNAEEEPATPTAAGTES